MDIQKLHQDNQGFYKLPHTYEKSYSLTPDDSIKFENKFFIQPLQDKIYGFVEISLQNMMKDEVTISGFHVLPPPPEVPFAKFIELYELNMQGQAIPRKTTFKFVMKYELSKKVVNVKNYGKVQFYWRSKRADVDGGVLAYTIESTLEKKEEDLLVERADSKILKKTQMAEVELAFTNMYART